MLGLYLHVPFCGAICHYCNFTRGLFDSALAAQYVEALETEVRRAAEPATPADTIYFGGGTPSLLEPGQIARLVRACREAFAVPAAAEVTLEANPDTIDEPRLAGFREAGVTRLSLGVQSFRDAELARLGRTHDAAAARRALAAARSAGFDNVSLDLMMWLPGQTVADWLASVDALIDCAPEHASLYLLELYPHAPLRDAMARAGWSVAPDEDAAVMYLEALARLDAAGYRQYEIASVARPGRESRHNLKYWSDGSWVGFGCAAHSTRGAARWRNVSATSEYLARIAAGVSPRVDVETRSPALQLEEALFMGLRRAEGVDLDRIRRTYGVDVWKNYGDELGRFVEAGWLAHDPGQRLALTRRGMLVANEILLVFIGRPVR